MRYESSNDCSKRFPDRLPGDCICDASDEHILEPYGGRQSTGRELARSVYRPFLFPRRSFRNPVARVATECHRFVRCIASTLIRAMKYARNAIGPTT